MSTALVKDDRYLEHNAGEGHPESPNRLRVIHGLLDAEFRNLPLIPPRLATEDELALVHDPHYIRQVAITEGVAFSRLDLDTGLSARSFEIARLAAGGLLEAVDLIFSPDASRLNPRTVFALVRPPGHHAEGDRGMGFCIFNNVAIAAEYAIRKHGARRVLIVDWDLHHGNGTQRSFYDRPDVLFFSSHQYPHYPGSGSFEQTGTGKGEGFTVNAPLPSGFGDSEYIAVYDRVVRPIALEYLPDLLLVSAGFDTYIRDPLGGMKVTGAGFSALTAIVRDIAEQTCGGRLILTLEGGYNPEGLREGVRAVLGALTDPLGTVPVPSSHNAERVINTIISRQKKYWKSLK